MYHVSAAANRGFTAKILSERLFMQLLQEKKGKIPHTSADRVWEGKHVIHMVTALSEVLCIYQAVEPSRYLIMANRDLKGNGTSCEGSCTPVRVTPARTERCI